MDMLHPNCILNPQCVTKHVFSVSYAFEAQDSVLSSHLYSGLYVLPEQMPTSKDAYKLAKITAKIIV